MEGVGRDEGRRGSVLRALLLDLGLGLGLSLRDVVDGLGGERRAEGKDGSYDSVSSEWISECLCLSWCRTFFRDSSNAASVLPW